MNEGMAEKAIIWEYTEQINEQTTAKPELKKSEEQSSVKSLKNEGKKYSIFT